MDEDVDRALERQIVDDARRGRVEAPPRRIVTDTARDLISRLAVVLLIVIAIAVISALDRSRRSEVPAIEYATITGSIIVFAAVITIYRRRGR